MEFSDFYKDLQADRNNMSYWLPKIQNQGLRIPKTCIIPMPEKVMDACFMDGDRKKNMAVVGKWVTETVMPKLEEESLTGLIFVKNGCFSNKFDFRSCSIIANPLALTASVIDINYQSFMFDAGGNTELAIRERIPYDEEKTPTIYNGLPLRNEYRIFYDFDNHKPLYIVNYWDWDYCHDSICRVASDRIIYESAYPELEEHYEKEKNTVLFYVNSGLKNVTGLSGIWSVDILEDESGTFWLIDMAVGQQSAYWDPEKFENHVNSKNTI
jgi:hypothetical protein